MKVPIGWGDGPDCGPWWATEDKIYWANGEITANANDGYVWRTSICGTGLTTHVNDPEFNYSLWSDERRQAVKEEMNRLRSLREQEEAAEQEEELAMLNAIRSKLTQEEWAFMKSRFEYEPECGWPDEPEEEP